MWGASKLEALMSHGLGIQLGMCFLHVSHPNAPTTLMETAGTVQ